MTLEGKITLSYSPPNFDAAFWDSHPNLVQIKELLGLNDEVGSDDDVGGEDWSDGDDDDGEAEDKGEDESEDEAAAALPAVSRNKFDLLDDEDD